MQEKPVSRSVDRFIAILEIFEEERRPMSSSELTERLDGPRSSIAELLSALVARQVLTLNRRKKTYFPTAKLARLGAWHINDLLMTSELKQALKMLRDQLEETVVLSTPLDLSLEVVHFEQGPRPLTLQVQPGGLFSLWGTAVGTAYLSTLAMPTVRSMLLRARKQSHELSPPHDFDLGAFLKPMRREGVSVVDGAVDSSLTAIAIPMLYRPAGRRVILSVGGPSERIRRSMASIIAHLKEAANKDLWLEGSIG